MSSKTYLKKVGVLSPPHEEKGFRKTSAEMRIATHPSISVEEPGFDRRSVSGVVRDMVEQQISLSR